MKNIKIYTSIIIGMVVFLSSCIDYKIENPEKTVYNPNLTENTTIQELKDLLPPDKDLFLIETDVIILGTVTANDKSGNYYKAIVIQDSTTGIQIDINSYGLHNKYHVGDLVYVKCKGLYIGNYGGQPKLGFEYEGSIGRISYSFMDDFLFKSDGGNPVKPKELDLSATNNDKDILINQLVIIKNSQFKYHNVGGTYSNADINEDKDIYLENCNGKTMIVRTSGYADFARDIVPGGNGSVIAIMNKYNDTYQLAIRDVDEEVIMNGERCGQFFNEDFEIFEDYDEINQYGWTSYSVTDSEKYWYASTYQNNRFAKMSGFNYDTYLADDNEDWLITPKFDFTDLTSVQLSFENSCNYNGPDLEVFISVDYDGSGNPNDFNWTELTGIALSSGSYAEVTATADLASYIGSTNVFIGFKYTSLASLGGNGAKTWQIDDVTIIAE